MKKKYIIQCLLLGITAQLIANALINSTKNNDNQSDFIQEDSFENPYDMNYIMPEKISYENIVRNLRIITIEQEETTIKHLMYKIDSHDCISNFNIPYLIII